MLSREFQSLSDLVPEDMFVGTSLILRQGDRFLYGVRPPQMEGARQVVELTGIGGGMEDEDESPTASVLREVEEEIGCDVRLLPCDETVVVRGPDRIERIVLQGEEQPIVVIFRRFSTPPHQPWHESGRGEICVVIFLAELDGQPRPVAELELPALLWLRPAHILETARRDVPLRELLDSGAEMVGGGAGPLPEAAWARMTDSQEALALALGDGALSFYRALAKVK